MKTRQIATGFQWKPSQGFTLIEVMIVVVIIGILAMISYPSYQEHVRKTKRADAKVALTELANLQEKFFGQCSTYTTSVTGAFPKTFGVCAGNGLGALSSNSPDGYYTLSITSTGATNYTLTATAKAGTTQANDKPSGLDCTVLNITSIGSKTPAGCW